MATNKLRGKELRQLGYPEKKVISIALGLMERNYKKRSKTFKLDLLAEVLAEPEKYLKDKILGQIAEQLAKPSPKFNNLSEFKTYKTFGERIHRNECQATNEYGNAVANYGGRCINARCASRLWLTNWWSFGNK